MAGPCIQKPKISDFGFKVEDFSVFHRPQWPKFPCIALAVYRVVVVLYILGFFSGLLVISIRNQGGDSFVYLTTWAFLIFIAYNVVATLNIFMDGYIRRDNAAEGVQIRHQTHWFFFAITTNLNFLVTIVYWSALHVPSIPLIYDLTMHTLTSVVCLVDLLLTAIPVRLLHFIYPLIVGFIYLLFTLIFWAAGGFNKDPIYPFLDYSNHPSQTAAAIVGIVVAIILMQGAVWALYKLRIWIWQRTGNNARSSMQIPWTDFRDEGNCENENAIDDGLTTGQI